MDRTGISEALNDRGYANLGPMLAGKDIATLKALYPQKDPFRSHIIMRRHDFGEGEYTYFSNPLPTSVAGSKNICIQNPEFSVMQRWRLRQRARPHSRY